MDVYTIFYYPVDYGIELAKDRNIPVADEILYLNRRVEKKICKECLMECFQSFVIYRVDQKFIVKNSTHFTAEELRFDKDYLFLTVLTKNHQPVAIIDWINLFWETVFILPSYFLNVFVYNLMRNGDFDFFSLASENFYNKEKRRFGFGRGYLGQVFKKELEELEIKIKEKK